MMDQRLQSLYPAIRNGHRPIGVPVADWRRAVRQYKAAHPGFRLIDPLKPATRRKKR
jgi:hypothetical protein